MDYTEVVLKISPLLPYREVLIYELGESGFESFVDIEDGVKAYMPLSLFDLDMLKEIIERTEAEVNYTINSIEEQNWNAEWEKGLIQ